MGELRGEDCFHPVDKEERRLASGPARGRLDRPQSRGKFIDPLLATLIDPIKGSCLESLENLHVFSLYLPIAMRMSNQSKADLDPDFFVVLDEGFASELCAVVGDDALGIPKW